MKKFILLLAFVGITANARFFCDDKRFHCKDGFTIPVEQSRSWWTLGIKCTPIDAKLREVSKKCDNHGGFAHDDAQLMTYALH